MISTRYKALGILIVVVNMPSALIETYGCTLNHADSEIMENLLRQRGFSVDNGRFAEGDAHDYVIINTCTVKTPTEQRILDRIEKASGKGGRLIVAGCMASANADRIRRVAPNASILTTSNVHRIADAVGEIERTGRAVLSSYSKVDKLEQGIHSPGVIAKIPISEGCLSSCSFCETKFARGPLNSFSDKLILKAIELSVKGGAKEIELTSQDVGAYGLDRKTNIGKLLADISCIEGDFKVRVGMLNPEHLHKYIDELIAGYKDGRIYRFIHLPLQSASNRVLKEMGRGYTMEQFCTYLSELRSKIPEISIETDIIVGYPGESADEFEESMDFIRKSRPTFTNVSRFGVRPHARASRLEQLPTSVIKERSSGMSRLARSVQREDFGKLVGIVESALITEENGKSLIARDDSYRIMALDRQCGAKIGDRVLVKAYANTSVCLLGRIVGTDK